MSNHYITCQKCKTENINEDYCQNCGEIINIQLKRKLEQQKVVQQRIQEELNRTPSKFEAKLNALENHSNIFIKGFFLAVKGVYMLIMTIGAIFAYIIGTILA